MSDGELGSSFKTILELTCQKVRSMFLLRVWILIMILVSNGFGIKYDLNLYLKLGSIRYMQHQNYFGLDKCSSNKYDAMLNIGIKYGSRWKFQTWWFDSCTKNSGLLNIGRCKKKIKLPLNIPLFKVEKYIMVDILMRLIIENMNFSYFEK